MARRGTFHAHLLGIAAFLGFLVADAQQLAPNHPSPCRIVTGQVVADNAEVLPNVEVIATWNTGHSTTTTNSQGRFSIGLPCVPLTVAVRGAYIGPNQLTVPAGTIACDLKLQINYTLPRVEQTLVITATAPDPAIDRRNDTIYKNTLFLRDDQLFDTLDGGINAGQHEGGGKSIEVRRFGFNLDHGGQNGGLKVLVDDVPQNQATQGHGQGYLGSLKSLSPELVDGVDIINGPFSAEYGDFSALGVIHIRLKEHLDDRWIFRGQGGSFNGYRTFLGWSLSSKRADSLIAWEHAHTDGPFLNPLHYARDNLTGNYTRRIDAGSSLGIKFNSGRSNFDSSGQIPLDLVYAGVLPRFGYMDPSDGGRVRNGTGGAYFKRSIGPSDTFRADAFVARSLFDLFSNFTFYLNDPENGDGIQQHDSRVADGSSVQYLHSGHVHRIPALLIVGGNLTDNWINVDLFHQEKRKIIGPVPGIPSTRSNVHILNPAAYAQEELDIPHLRIEAGLRFDAFRFSLADRVASTADRSHSLNLEPKMNVIFTPSIHLPLSIHANYGRAVTSQDARGIAIDRSAPKAAATNFYIFGTSHRLRRLSASTDVFLIDRQHEDVYQADNGALEYHGPSRSYGWEAKASAEITLHLAWNAGLTQVMNAFYRGTAPREYVDGAPHSVANSGVTLNEWHGLYSSLRYRHISRYLLVNSDESPASAAVLYSGPSRATATGLDVLDFAETKKLYSCLEWNLSIDNLNNKRYYETQNFFNSRTAADAPVEARVHGTPGYPIGFTTGVTWRFE
jgi:hypothetical protein